MGGTQSMKSAGIGSLAARYARIGASHATRAGLWWLTEFLNLFPERTAKWLVGPGRATLVLADDGDARILELLDSDEPICAATRLRSADFSAESIDGFLRTHGVRRGDADIVIRLPQQMFFRRKLILPTQAAASIDQIVAADLVRKTPFRLQDIYHGHSTTTQGPSGKIVVWQWLVRRAFVHDAASAFNLSVDDVAFVHSSAGNDAARPTPRIALHSNAKNRRSWIKTSVLLLLCSVGLLTVATAVLKYQRQQALIDENDSRIAAARVRAQKVRSEFDRVQGRQNVLLHLRSQRLDAPGLLDVWEEATRVLPTHSWLTELRLTEVPEKNEQLVAMNGFSAGATDLVKLIDRSPLLADASLTAPVTIDPVEGRERFALQAKVKRSDPYKEATR
jgi:general secretion pathway protein L